MKYSLRTENMELSEFDVKQLDKKIERLRNHLTPPFEMDINIKHDRHHNKGQVVTCKINIEQGKKVLHAERTGQSAQDAIDVVIEAIKHELEKEHDKKKRHRNR